MNLPTPTEVTPCQITPAIWDALERKRVTPEHVHRCCPNVPVLLARWELDRAHDRRRQVSREVSRILDAAVPIVETPVQQDVAYQKRSTFNT